MRLAGLLMMTWLAALPAGAQNPPRFLYSINRQTISAFSIDPQQGTLTSVGSWPFPANLPGTVAADLNGRFLFAGTSGHGVAVFQIDPATGALTRAPGSPFATGSRHQTALAIDATGRFVYAGLDEGVTLFTVDAQLGTLTPEGPSGNTGSLVGEMLAYPNAPWLFVSEANSGVYSIDPATGALTGTGAPQLRGHLALNPAGNRIYCTGCAWSFDATSGGLSPITGPSLHPPSGPLAVDQSDRFIYSARAKEPSVRAFVLDVATGGLLSGVPGSPFSAGTAPDAITAEPSGKFLYVANKYSGNISAYSIDGVSGALTPIAGSPYPLRDVPRALLVVSPTSTSLPSLTSLAVTPASVSINSSQLGEQEQFTAVGQYSDGSTRFLTASSHWQSSVPHVATIDSKPNHSGRAMVKGYGTTTITASLNGLSATATIAVNRLALVSLAVTPASPTLDTQTSLQFKATGTYTDGSQRNLTKSAQWSSSVASVASISATGNALALAAGSTTITATVGSASGTASLTVE